MNINSILSSFWSSIKAYLSNNYLGKTAKAESAKSADSVAWANVSGKPTIPTVNNGTLTIQKNGTTVKTFTAYRSNFFSVYVLIYAIR